MAENIVQSLFGPMPYEIDAARRQQDMDYASKMAGMNNIQQAKLGIGQGAAGLARAAGGMFGMVDPAQQEAQARQQAMSGVDPSSSRSLMEAAMRTQDPRLKMQLGLLAQQRRAAEQKASMEAQKMALDARKQDFTEKEALDFKYAKLSQDYELAKERANDQRLAAADRAAASREANQIRLQIAQMANSLGRMKLDVSDTKKQSTTEAQKSVDKAFSKDYVAWKATGGISAFDADMQKLQEAIDALESGRRISGPVTGLIPDVAKSFVNPESKRVRDDVGSVVQKSLRAILGGQFAQKEGEALLKRSYDESLDEKTNAARLKILKKQLQDAAEAKESAAEYYEREGTLEGYKGPKPNDAFTSKGVVSGTPKSAIPPIPAGFKPI